LHLFAKFQITSGFIIKASDVTEERNKGVVLIDDIDISKVALSRLRRSIAIIPQDPTYGKGWKGNYNSDNLLVLIIRLDDFDKI
jgi:hypothetical protein